jgi:hypothetical protein
MSPRTGVDRVPEQSLQQGHAVNILRRCLVLAMILPGFCWYLVFSGTADSHARDEQAMTAGLSDRLREGTMLDTSGTFKHTGDRIMFYASGDSRRFGTLENLNLERISRVISETSEALEWNISGTVTEFQGTNYLLVSRAILKSKPQRRGTVGPAAKNPGESTRSP